MFRNIRWGSVLGGFIAGIAGTRLIRTKKARKIAESLMTGGYIAREFFLEETEQAQTWLSDAAAAAKERADAYLAAEETQADAE